MKCTSKITARRAGFTLIETVIALAIFSVLGYGLALTATLGQESQAEVQRVATENRDLREASSWLLDEMRSTGNARVTTTVLADSNNQVRFMVPIDDAGVASWGVYDKRLGGTAALQNRAGWLVQYTVKNVVLNGAVDKQLVRQILDTALTVQREDVLAHGLRSGTDVPPGFKVAMNGAMWEITLSTDGPQNGSLGKKMVLHVKTRN